MESSNVYSFVCLAYFTYNVLKVHSAVACIQTSTIFMAGLYSNLWIYPILCIHSSADGCLGRFHLFAIVNSAAMNIYVQVCVWVPLKDSFGFVSRSRMAGSWSFYV